LTADAWGAPQGDGRQAVGYRRATAPQIATFTGQCLKNVGAILDAHYLGRDIQLAESLAS
jgi:hypothetical protein